MPAKLTLSICLIFTALTSALCGAASREMATDALNAIDLSRLEVRVTGIKHYRPYSFYENDRPGGLYSDIIKELFKRAGVGYRLELQPFDQLLKKVELGYSDAMVGAFHTPERAQYADFVSTKVSAVSTSLFIRTDNPIRSAQLPQLKGLTIGVKQGFLMSDEFEAAADRQFFEKYQVETVKQLIKMLLQGRLDGFVHNTEQSLFHLEDMDKHREIKPMQPLIVNHRPSFIAFSKLALQQLPHTLMPAIEASLLTMARDGSLAELHAKYALPYSAPAP